ncbi:YegS/Rv2252/BmrU family lipid kinase [Planktothrix mougeotii]|uniref:YegS/Rv2252/BmrU family lipid kinase n=1 Tax=Planktothrix mougeotii LEGE 06226 TaxID=1828728 RepID=A0ABR9U7V6_9CYAN|nr:YegS/Rv2252/BmrU family lipid kinase [Planktothrix mougeotii]MBE9142539.1 YegS/Rv2252/BmrU family lipid kinase [Planktothrix mougeotii LEGE 06226]
MTAIIALLADETQQETLVNFITQHENVLSHYRLMGLDNLAGALKQRTWLRIETVLPLRQAGDMVIASKIIAGEEIAAVIYLVEPTQTTFSELPLLTLLRVCNIYNIPMASNIGTAEAIIVQLRRTRSAYLIFNPVSGVGNANQDLLLIRQLLEPYFHLKVHLTTPETDPTELAKEAVEQQVDLVIASGGDGTVSAVAGAVINTNIPLGIIPRGTANAFSVALGIPTNLQGACEVIIAGLIRTIDVANCNGLPMILLAGIGFEAETVSKADRETKKRWGPLAYIMAGWQQLNEQTDFETEIEINGEINQCEAAAITVANVAPATSVLAQGLGQVIPDDGLLEVLMYTSPVDKMQALAGMVRLLGAGLLKTEIQRDNMIAFRTQRLKISTNPPQKVVLDGEIIGTTPIEVECVPKGLKIMTPAISAVPNVEEVATLNEVEMEVNQIENSLGEILPLEKPGL